MIYCPEIFHGLFVNPSTDVNVEYAPCCQASTQLTPNESIDFNNSDFLNKLRAENLNNIKSSECRRCWEAEDSGLRSKRQSALDFYNNEIDTNIELHTLEYNITWACNLGCIMCSPKFSSTLAQELNVGPEIKLENSKRKKNPIVEQLNLNKLKRIHFNGGEPLINAEHIKVLKNIPDLSKCKVSYNTNGTKIPSAEVLKYWSKCKSVRVFFSIDAVGNAFDYIRWNAKWNEVSDNLKWFIDNSPSNVMFGVNTTIGMYNLLEINALWRWFNEEFSTNRKGDKSDFNWQKAYNFDFAHLRKDIKEIALNEMIENNTLESLQRAVSSSMSSSSNDEWVNKLNVIDHRRGTNWRTSLKIGKFY